MIVKIGKAIPCRGVASTTPRGCTDRCVQETHTDRDSCLEEWQVPCSTGVSHAHISGLRKISPTKYEREGQGCIIMRFPFLFSTFVISTVLASNPKRQCAESSETDPAPSGSSSTRQ